MPDTEHDPARSAGVQIKADSVGVSSAFVCPSCTSRYVTVRDHAGHGQSDHFRRDPGLSSRCHDCEHQWETPMNTETDTEVKWNYWCPDASQVVFAPNELHVGVTVDKGGECIGAHVVAVLPPVPTQHSVQPEPFARAFVAGLKDCTAGWSHPDGFFAGLRAHGFEFPMPKEVESPIDADEAVMQMIASDREEAEGRALAAEAELEKVLPWLRWVIEIKGDEPCRYDHHGYCQAHNLDERPCPVEQIQEYLDELDDGEVDLSSPFTDEMGKTL